MAGTVVLAGGDELRPGCEEMDRRVLQEAGGGEARVVFLPTAVARHYPRESGRAAIAYFDRLDARCEVAMILTRADAEQPEQVGLIERASLVYLGGGDPDVLLDVLAGSAAWAAALRVYERGGVIGGSSAGAMVMCSHTLLPGTRGIEGTPWVEGLGVVRDALVLPHYTAQRAGSLATLAGRMRGELSSDAAVLGIPEHTALLGNGAAWEVAGPGQVRVHARAEARDYGRGERVVLTGSGR